MKSINIFLDDERVPQFVEPIMKSSYPSDWIIIRNFQDFCQTVSKHGTHIALVSFDHDIASFEEDGVEKTGKDAARFLTDYCQDHGVVLPNFVIHTQNPIGRQNISGHLVNYLAIIENKKVNWQYYHNGYINGKLI